LKKKAIYTKKAPEAVGPYSQAIISGNMLFLSGQVGINPKTNELSESIEEQTEQIFKNIKNILTKADADMSNIVKVTVFLEDIDNFKKVNNIYANYFKKPYPARSAFAVDKLPLSAKIEIEVIAIL